MHLLNGPGKNDGISQSIIYNFMTCAKAGMYTVEGWEDNGMEGRVRLGNICHHVLEQMHRGNGHTEEDIDRFLRDPKLMDDLNTHRKQDSVQIDLAKAEALMCEYVRARPEEFTGRVHMDAEMVFDFVWNGWRLRGKIDAIYVDKRAARWMMEHKTRGRINESKLLRMLAIDFQIQFYKMVWEVWKGQPLRGVHFNIIRNPGTKPHVGEDLLAYKQRLRKEIAKQPAYYFVRFPVKFTEKDRADFEWELIQKLAYIERLCNGKQPVFMNQTACGQCDYLDLCVAGETGKYHKKGLFDHHK